MLPLSVKLLNVVDPEISWAKTEPNTTVPLLWLNVPVFVQWNVMVVVPDAAVKVPAFVRIAKVADDPTVINTPVD